MGYFKATWVKHDVSLYCWSYASYRDSFFLKTLFFRAILDSQQIWEEGTESSIGPLFHT